MPEWSRNTPWRQGSILSAEAIAAIGLSHPESPTDTVVIIATHDCDLTQLPAREPQVEIVIGRKILAMDGNYTHAKSSRTLHIRLDGFEPLLTEFVTTGKTTIAKNALADFQPNTNSKLSQANMVVFQQWLASRYRRSAFPDEFEHRLSESKLHDKIAKAVKPHGDLITAVFLDVDDGQEITRTGPDDVYVLDIYLLHAVEPDFNLAESAAKNAMSAIQNAFKTKLYDSQIGWQFIELRLIEVISQDSMTYSQSQLLKKWRLDYISLGADPQQPILEG